MKSVLDKPLSSGSYKTGIIKCEIRQSRKLLRSMMDDILIDIDVSQI